MSLSGILQPLSLQGMAAADKEFWKAARQRLEDLGFSTAERGTLRGLLLAKTRAECEEYLDGHDDEVRNLLKVLLSQGARV